MEFMALYFEALGWLLAFGALLLFLEWAYNKVDAWLGGWQE